MIVVIAAGAAGLIGAGLAISTKLADITAQLERLNDHLEAGGER